ncbi:MULTISPECIES: MlaD family protein [unclassified Algibacter]|uniref:MlaD family protein n=1 Tax=unclassified Algibacter TaxID=2615009 RepID=UPI00131DCBFE|nr:MULTISPECIES: MlaD family protein [unclassified Algibacter]MCL5127942.1 MlaD family protein [Algibacter sp. L4_22]
MKISREVKTGILVLLGILLFIFGFNYLKGQNLLDSSKTYYAVYDNVEGLVPSTPVTINGLNVGKVVSIKFKEDGSGKLLVKLMVDNDFEFSKNSTAQLYDTGLIGGKAIAILPAFDKAGNAESESVLNGTVKVGLTDALANQLTPLQGKIEKMLTSADALISNLNDVLDEKGKANLKTSLASLSVTMKSFEGTSKSLNQIMQTNESKITTVLTNAEIASNDLAKMTSSLSKSDLAATMKNLETTLASFNNIMANLEKGEGSMGKLLKDDALYNNLEGATEELESLLKDFKLHPNRYTRILSKKEIPYKEPETN